MKSAERLAEENNTTDEFLDSAAKRLANGLKDGSRIAENESLSDTIKWMWNRYKSICRITGIEKWEIVRFLKNRVYMKERIRQIVSLVPVKIGCLLAMLRLCLLWVRNYFLGIDQEW